MAQDDKKSIVSNNYIKLDTDSEIERVKSKSYILKIIWISYSAKICCYYNSLLFNNLFTVIAPYFDWNNDVSEKNYVLGAINTFVSIGGIVGVVIINCLLSKGRKFTMIVADCFGLLGGIMISFPVTGI